MAKARVVVLGGSGRLGRLLAHAWAKTPPPFDIIWQSRAVPADLVWDMHSPPPDLTADAVLCLAGVTPPYAQRTGAAMADNVTLAMAAVSAAKAWGAQRVLVASSAAVYGPGTGALTEESPLNPANDYGKAKAEMEQALAAVETPEVCCLRIGNVVGVDALLGQTGDALTTLTLDRFPNGHGPQRSYCGPQGLARVIAALLVCRALLPKALNVAAPDPVYMEDLLSAAGLVFAWRPAPPQAIQSVVFDTQRLETLAPGAVGSGEATRMVAEWRALL